MFGEYAKEWNQYILDLKHSALKFNHQEDELKWSENTSVGVYTTKLGYETRMEEEKEGEKKHWW